jgi:hypothetical protein
MNFEKNNAAKELLDKRMPFISPSNHHMSSNHAHSSRKPEIHYKR